MGELNGRKKLRGDIEWFVRQKLNIKVDNYCQFLAQDKVSEFAELTPSDLLFETEKAIENNLLLRQHEYLIEQGDKAYKELKKIEGTKSILAQQRQAMENLQSSIELSKELQDMQY